MTSSIRRRFLSRVLAHALALSALGASAANAVQSVSPSGDGAALRVRGAPSTQGWTPR